VFLLAGMTFLLHDEGGRTIFVSFNADHTATISAFYAAGAVTGIFVAGPSGRGNLYTPIGAGQVELATIQPPLQRG
jgi:hypothetical protein